MKILVLDPGDHTGWVFRDSTGGILGGTINEQSLLAIENLFVMYRPDIVVYETFRLYAGAAQSMINSEFYTVQVIGAIRLLAQQRAVTCVYGQTPSVKKFAGELDERWKNMAKIGGRTEHVKDAYLHLKYFERFGPEKKAKVPTK